MSLWNSDYYVALEGRDLQANAMAVDSSGTYVLLAGRRYIAIRNLDEELEVVQKFPRQSKYDVGVAEWNPVYHARELSVISSNQRLEVLTWRSQELVQTHSLRAHTRVITDLNWHRFDPNLLASCSVDTFIHIWDLRDARRPSISLSAIAEASQVRWNKVSTHLLATTHDGDIKIWDQRKGTAPVQYIAAHLSKIYGLDWNSKSESQLATSSQDNTVKFFDMANPRRPEYVLNTNAPVWRSRFTPFGTGLVTVVVPQLRRGENSLLLWNTTSRSTPMHTFVGHKDVVLEFAWRKQQPGSSDFHLITWSKDQTLLIWKVQPFLQKLCGYEPDEAKDIAIGGGGVETKKRTKVLSKVEPLQQEFSLLNVHIPNLEVTTMNPTKRICTVVAKINNLKVVLQVTFPNTYPYGASPVFEILPDTTVSEAVQTEVLDNLNNLAQQRVSKNRTCLESCLRQMVTIVEQLTEPVVTNKIDPAYVEPVNLFSRYNDAYIPSPRTSGVKFCSVGILVCFGRTSYTKRKNDTMRLRSMERLTDYFYQGRAQNSKKLIKAVVHVYDVSGLLLKNKQLAEEYILGGDTATICKHNAATAAIVGRSDLVQAWTLAELTTWSPSRKEQWFNHPFGRQLLETLISHYNNYSDVQMVAMLSCIFGKHQVHTVEDKLMYLSETLNNDQLQMGKSSSVYEYYKLKYVEVLHRWGLLYNRAEVLKLMYGSSRSHNGVELSTKCRNCNEPTKHGTCSICKKFSLNCVICHLSVRGSANCCMRCGHGGHTKHLQAWFEKRDICPAGCGCHCLSEVTNIFQ